MRHWYKKIFAYNPTENKVTVLKIMPESALFNSRMMGEGFWEVYNAADHTSTIIIGASLTNTYYQLSPAPYGTYIKEDAGSMEMIDRIKLLGAISRYQTEHKLWSNDYD